MNPALQVHVRDPGMFKHVALTSQPPLFVRHSLMSAQVRPLPVNPELQTQAPPTHDAVDGQSSCEVHELTAHVPVPEQYVAGHSASGSVVAPMKLQTPSDPLPFFAAEQA
jgi:hypothetical protein